MSKEVVIKVNTGAALAISQLVPIQGELKELPSENEKKLRRSILKHGFSFPIFVWEDPKDAQIKIIDGHQRIKVLQRLKKDGYKIPQIPVVMIEADDFEHAKEKLLAAASQYGKFTEHGVVEFIQGIDMSGVVDMIEVPFIEMAPVIKVSVTEHERELKNTSHEVNVDEFQDFDHQCPKCGFEFNE